MIYFGIDVTKYTHRLVAIDTEGTIFIRHLQIKNNCDVFTKHQMTLANLQKTIGKSYRLHQEVTLFGSLERARASGPIVHR